MSARATPRLRGTPLPRDLGRLARAGAALVALVAAAVLLGWITGTQWLMRVDPTFGPMKPNTALCLLLLGGAWFVGTRLATAGLTVVALVAVLTLIEHLSGVSLGLDTVLFADPTSTQPGRMSVAVCLCVLALAGSLCCLIHARHRLLTVVLPQVLAVGTLITSSTALLGYLFSVPELYARGSSTAMALNTSFVLGVLSLVLLRAVPGGYLRWILADEDPGAVMLHRVLPLTYLVIPGGVYLNRLGENRGLFSVGVGLVLRVTVSVAVVTVACISIAQRITRADRSRAEAMQSLQDLNEELDERVAERAAELEEARRVAELSHDRERIAADIHDLAIQRLYAVALSLDTMTRTGNSSGVGAAIDTIDEVIAELRGTIHNLRRPVGSATVSTILAEIAEIGQEHGFTTELRVAGDVDALPVALGVHLTAVLRECVSNAVRHSHGSALSISLKAGADEVSLVVADDGDGLPDDLARVTGLRDVRARAEELGGLATWAANQPSGTVVAWHVPLVSRAERVAPRAQNRPRLAETAAGLVRHLATCHAAMHDCALGIARIMARHLDADTMAVLVDTGADEILVIASDGYDPDLAGLRLDRESSLAGHAMATGRTLKVDRLSNASAAAARHLGTVADGPTIMIPLAAPGLSASVNLGRWAGRLAFDRTDVEDAEVLAGIAGTTLAERIERQPLAALV